MTSWGQHRNPAIVARASRLIVVETDTPERLAEFEALGLPPTVTVRPRARLEAAPLVPARGPRRRRRTRRSAWRQPRSRSTSTGCSSCRPRSIPTGTVYSFVRRLRTSAIATMPKAVYDAARRPCRRDESGLRESMAEEIGFRVPEGARREMLFRFACMCRRWTASEPLIRDLA